MQVKNEGSLIVLYERPRKNRGIRVVGEKLSGQIKQADPATDLFWNEYDEEESVL
jgi:hypothetical protein